MSLPIYNPTAAYSGNVYNPANHSGFSGERLGAASSGTPIYGGAGSARQQPSEPSSFVSVSYAPEGKRYNFSGILRTILQDRDCKRVFIFSVMLSVVFLIELIYSSISGSIGLLSMSFHTLFDCFSLLIALSAMILAKQSPSWRFSYGYDRFEVLSSFSNGVFLLFVSLFMLFEGIEKLLEPHPLDIEDPHALSWVALLALVVDLTGVFFFGRGRKATRETMRARDENIQSILLHTVSDAALYIAIIVSNFLMSWGLHSADPILGLIMVVVLVRTALPVCERNALVLMQATPPKLKDQIDKALREASTVDGVLETRNEHFWTHAPGVQIGSFSLRVRSDANEQAVLHRVQILFAPLLAHLTVQVEKDDWHLAADTRAHTVAAPGNNSTVMPAPYNAMFAGAPAMAPSSFPSLPLSAQFGVPPYSQGQPLPVTAFPPASSFQTFLPSTATPETLLPAVGANPLPGFGAGVSPAVYRGTTPAVTANGAPGHSHSHAHGHRHEDGEHSDDDNHRH